MKKKKGQDATAGETHAKEQAARPLKKAVPPPDNPQLRHQSDAEREGGGDDDAARARARVEALRQTRAMSTSDEPGDEPKGNC